MKKLQALAVGIVLACLVGVRVASSRDADAGKLRVTILDVGQADCLVVETPDRRTMLIDGGGGNDESQIDASNVGLKTVVPYLHYRGIDQVDVIMLTHPHSDHVGGLLAVLKEERVGAILDGTVLDYPSPSYQAFLAEVRARHIPYRKAVRGMQINFQDGVVCDVLNPPALGRVYGIVPDNETVNNYSAVVRLSYGRTHFMFDGDAEVDAEQNILTSGMGVNADVLKCGHHGAANATSYAWLGAVHPRFAVISCGAHNTFGHSNPATLERLRAHGATTFVTAQDGGIVFVSDGQAVTATQSTTADR